MGDWPITGDGITSSNPGLQLEAWYSGAGAPSVSTLVAGTYNVGDRYWDTANKVDYECDTSGSASTSTWTKIGPSGSSPITKLYYADDIYILSNTETTIFSFSLPANTLTDVASKAMHVIMRGAMQNGDGGQITLRAYIGTAKIFDTGAVSPPQAVANPNLDMDWWSGVSTAAATKYWFNTWEMRWGGGAIALNVTQTPTSSTTLYKGVGIWDQAHLDWTVPQTVKVTVQGSGVNEGWTGFVIVYLEGQ